MRCEGCPDSSLVALFTDGTGLAWQNRDGLDVADDGGVREMCHQEATELWAKQRYLSIEMRSEVGKTEARYYEAPGSTKAVIWVGGIGGGFDTPAKKLYPRLSEELVSKGISSLRVRFRNPTDLTTSVEDVLVGIEYLQLRGVNSIALVGHSFGGAVVITAGALSPLVKTVITMSTQSYGADRAPQLAPRPLLLIHGARDPVLPPSSSEHVYAMARQPKELIVLEEAKHKLDEVSDKVMDTVRSWLLANLG